MICSQIAFFSEKNASVGIEYLVDFYESNNYQKQWFDNNSLQFVFKWFD